MNDGFSSLTSPATGSKADLLSLSWFASVGWRPGSVRKPRHHQRLAFASAPLFFGNPPRSLDGTFWVAALLKRSGVVSGRSGWHYFRLAHRRLAVALGASASTFAVRNRGVCARAHLIISSQLPSCQAFCGSFL